MIPAPGVLFAQNLFVSPHQSRSCYWSHNLVNFCGQTGRQENVGLDKRTMDKMKPRQAVTCHACSVDHVRSVSWKAGNSQLALLGETEARRQGFSPGSPVSSPPLSINGSANKTKLE